jgi:Flp pilus assembly protein TadD
LAAVWANKGNALVSQGKYDEAIRALDKATEIDSLNAKTWAIKRLVLQGLGRKAESKSALAKAKRLGFTGPTQLS